MKYGMVGHGRRKSSEPFKSRLLEAGNCKDVTKNHEEW